MGTDLISPHEVRILAVLRLRRGEWLSNAMLATEAKVSPPHRPLAPPARTAGGELGEQAQAYLVRVEKAREVFGG